MKHMARCSRYARNNSAISAFGRPIDFTTDSQAVRDKKVPAALAADDDEGVRMVLTAILSIVGRVHAFRTDCVSLPGSLARKCTYPDQATVRAACFSTIRMESPTRTMPGRTMLAMRPAVPPCIPSIPQLNG